MFGIGDLVTLQVPPISDWDLAPGCNNDIAYCASLPIIYKIVDDDFSRFPGILCPRISPYMYKGVSIDAIKKLWQNSELGFESIRPALLSELGIELPEYDEDNRIEDSIYAILNHWYADESWLIPYYDPESSGIFSLSNIITALSV